MRGVAVYVAAPLCNYQFVAGVISVPYVLLSIVPAWPAASLSTRHIPAARPRSQRTLVSPGAGHGQGLLLRDRESPCRSHWASFCAA